jgi:hypothetical protein
MNNPFDPILRKACEVLDGAKAIFYASASNRSARERIAKERLQELRRLLDRFLARGLPATSHDPRKPRDNRQIWEHDVRVSLANLIEGAQRLVEVACTAPVPPSYTHPNIFLQLQFIQAKDEVNLKFTLEKLSLFEDATESPWQRLGYLSLKVRTPGQDNLGSTPEAEAEQPLNEAPPQEQPLEEVWLTPSEALALAKEKGYDITRDWLSKQKGRMRTREPRLPGNHRYEIEKNSLVLVLFHKRKRKAINPSRGTDADEPTEAEREEIEARMRAESDRRRREQPLS